MRRVQLTILVVALSCLAAPVLGDDTCPPDLVWVQVEGSTAHVHHDHAHFNCCPTLEYEVLHDGWLIDIFEHEVLAQCFCECCFDLAHDLDNLGPGTYTVRVWGAYGCEDQPCGTAQFTILQGAGTPSLSSTMSSCGGWPFFADGFESGDLATWAR